MIGARAPACSRHRRSSSASASSRAPTPPTPSALRSRPRWPRRAERADGRAAPIRLALMNRALALGYEGVAQLARAVAAIAPRSHNKLLDTFAARRDVRRRFTAFDRDRGRPLLWMHAPSVGEGLQARPILELPRR